MAINLRSPYFTGTVEPNSSYAILELRIWSGSFYSPPLTAQYTLRKTVAGTSTAIFFELSELIRDYIDITFDGNYNGQAVWFQTVQNVFSWSSLIFSQTFTKLALDGYWYFEEPQTATPSVLISFYLWR